MTRGCEARTALDPVVQTLEVLLSGPSVPRKTPKPRLWGRLGMRFSEPALYNIGTTPQSTPLPFSVQVLLRGRLRRLPNAFMASPLTFPQMMPNISRKVRACTACQKQKVKCITEEGNRVCNRCRQNNLNCIFHRSLQTILDEDSRHVE